MNDTYIGYSSGQDSLTKIDRIRAEVMLDVSRNEQIREDNKTFFQFVKEGAEKLSQENSNVLDELKGVDF